MPGRPKKMAKMVTEFEERAFCLSPDVFSTIPKQYSDGPPTCPLGEAWGQCVNSTAQALVAIERLGDGGGHHR